MLLFSTTVRKMQTYFNLFLFFNILLLIIFLALLQYKFLMKKKYFYLLVFFFFCSIITVYSQDVKSGVKGYEVSIIEGLTLYPNPVTNGKVYIVSKNDLNKNITVFNILGRKVLQATVYNKELNISSLVPGVYLIKIEEESATATRKLIVK
jgi:hypothetical protein